MSESYFTTEAYPAHPRIEAWRQTIARFGLSLKGGSIRGGLYGTLASALSPRGILLGRLASGPQVWTCQAGKPGGMSMVVHLEGAATLDAEMLQTALEPGDIVYVPSGARAELSLDSDVRQLLVKLPRETLQSRLAIPISPRAGHIAGHSGAGRVLSGLLGSIAEVIEELGAEQLQAVDIALPEFLAGLLAAERPDPALLAPTNGQTATLHRISRMIEARLSDPDLSLSAIAAEAGVSVRYLQKLFEAVNDNFGRYLKMRRLERCRADLANPLYMHLSITDILFRWGFNDASYFSRVFREQYKMTPRAYRQEIGGGLSQTLLKTMNRGWPDITHDTYKKLTRNEIRPAEAWGGRALDRGEIGVSQRSPPRARTFNGFEHHHLAANDRTVHWGYLSHALPATLEVESGDYVTIETLSHHCGDDYERMIKGDSGVESVYHWTDQKKSVARRGAGPMGANIFGRGAGEGFGVQICTGPIAIRGAEPGDVVEIRILDARPRPCANARYADRAFGSNAAAWWGFHYKELVTEPKPREVVTIYEIDCSDGEGYVRPLYSFRWTPQTDPDGVRHDTIDYPGVCVDHAKITKTHDILKNVRLPLRPHFGLISLAPREADLVDSTPPAYFGGNTDNRRAGKGATVYLPVSVPGGLLSVGSPHAAQGDGQISGTAIECSLTGLFQIILHKSANHKGKPYAELDYPLLETPDEWVVHGFTSSNYLAELGHTAQSEIYKRSSLDPAMRDAVRKMRRFLMTAKGLSEDEAISLMSAAVDFGITQVVDGNWCVHAVLKKALFTGPGRADSV
jgi:acetamidase/formamidase/AraC-like DNA-binding protein